MPRDPRTLIFVGIKNHVLALDAATGDEMWRAKLKGSDFVSVFWDGQHLVAANAGEAFGIDPQSGAILWHNPMKGLGLGVVSLASSRVAPTDARPSGATSAAAAKMRHDAQSAAAAS